MGTTVVTIRSKEDRAKLHKWLDAAHDLTRVTFVGPKRSLPQNAAYWSALTDISRQAEYHGLKLAPEDWSQLFLDALNREARLVPNLDGTGFVNLRHSSSQLSHSDFSDLLEIVMAWGAQNGIEFHHDP
jgi:hypothetical protein